MSSPENETSDKNIAALLGNGVSIAYNRDLTVPKLTSDVMKVYNELSVAALTPGSPSDNAARALSKLAQDLSSGSADPETNFEQLLSPLEDVGEALGVLQDVTHLYGNVDPSIGSQMVSVTKFCEYVRRLGLSHVLELIDRRARAKTTDALISTFVDELAGATKGRLLIGTLNYDHLVDAALLNQHFGKHSDLGSGLKKVAVQLELDPDSPWVNAWGMRSEFDFTLDTGWCWSEGRRIVTLHLHGSLALLRDRNTGEVYRFQMQDLRDKGYWKLYREERTSYEPVVVLTNQRRKSSLVRSEPFRTAYSGLVYGLLSSDLWLIAGYSFQDECVNDVLREVWQARNSSGRPKILISTYGSDPDIDKIYNVLGAENNAKKRDVRTGVEFHRGGVAELTGSVEWRNWLA